MPGSYWILNEDGTRAFTAKEDVSDRIWNIMPSETPLLSLLSALGAQNLHVETIQDEDAAPDPENSHAIGDTRPTPESSQPSSLDNYVQRFMKSCRVSRAEQAGELYGVREALAYEEAKIFRENKRDAEARIVSDGQQQQPKASNNMTPKMAGLGSLITTNVDGSTSSVSVSALEDQIQTIVGDGGDPTDIFACGSVKKGLTSLRDSDSVVVQRQQGNFGKLQKDVQVISTSFAGQQNIHHHKWMPQELNSAAPDMMTLDPDMIRVRNYYGPRRTSLLDEGEGPGTFIDWWLTIDLKSEKSHAIMTNLS